LKSQSTPTSRARARSVAQKEIQKPNVTAEDFLKGALVIFGIILGVKIISDSIDALSGDEE